MITVVAHDFLLMPQELPSALRNQLLGDGPATWVSTEILPPPHGDQDARGILLRAAEALRHAGATALFFPDAPGGRARLDSVVAAGQVRQAFDIPCIAHINCRDRNRIALESALHVADLFELDGIKAVTGDPVREHMGQGVYDVKSVALVEQIARHSESFRELGVFVGHALGHRNPAKAQEGLWAKIEAGAQAIVTTPTLDPESLLDSLGRLGDLSVPLILGLVLIPSIEVLDFLQGEMATFKVPESFSERLKGAESSEAAMEVGVGAVMDLVEQVEPRVAGYHVVAPFGRWEGAVPLLEALSQRNV